MASSSGALTTLELVRLIAAHTDGNNDTTHYQKFITEAVKCGFIAGDEFDGWKGIDSKLCVILIHLSIEHVKNRNTFELPSFTKKVVSNVYSMIYTEYEKACQEMRWTFVPCIKGLSTLIKRKKSTT